MIINNVTNGSGKSTFIKKIIGQISPILPGERTRVNLIKLALSKINVLILVEAIKHPNIESIKLFYEVIKSFNGTIISVSHIR